MTTIYFDHISKFWIPITIVGLVQVTWAVIRSFWVPESPKILLT